MLGKFAAISLAVSFVAMATSGQMMFFIERPSFTNQMHPLHNFFGLLMVFAAITHIYLNYRSLFNHLKTKSASPYGLVLVVVFFSFMRSLSIIKSRLVLQRQWIQQPQRQSHNNLHFKNRK